jgi:hypothetical protein
MAAGAVACLLHGLFPFAFQSSGSRRIRELHARMVTHRVGATMPLKPPAWAPGLGLALVLSGLVFGAASLL